MELALSGRGVYLGITDKDKLLGQLEVLQTKEAQLQKKELFIMGGERVLQFKALCIAPLSHCVSTIIFLPGTLFQASCLQKLVAVPISCILLFLL